MTYFHARLEKADAYAKRNAKRLDKEAAEAATKSAAEATLVAHPEIGVLMRNGRQMYYVYPVGGEYREATNPAELILH
jgi:hypothetical protein